MTTLRTAGMLLACVIAFGWAPGNSAQAQTAPALQSAASRKSHGAATYDLGLPLAGGTGIECRQVSQSGLTLVLTFDKNIASGSASVAAGTASVGGTGVAGNQLLVPLTGLVNAQAVTVNYANVTPQGGGSAASGAVTFRLLEGDVNGNGSVTVADVNLAKYYVGMPVDAFNVRADVNGSASMTVSDVTIAKFRVGTSVAGGAQANTPPTIADVTDKTTAPNTATPAIAVAVGDGQTPAYALGLRATSNNQTLLPDANIALGGANGARTLTLTPAAGQTGVATVTVTVSDGLLTATDTFALTVASVGGGGGTPKLFLTSLRPEGSAQSAGSGSSTIQLSGDETYAIVRVSYSNLTTSKTGMHVHGPADPGVSGGILFDLDTTPPQADGSWRWTFVQSGNVSVGEQVAALKAGRLYVNVHSSKYPSGELRGHYLLASGSQNFTPPPAPPALPGGAISQADAARFLTQATFGPTEQAINEVIQKGYDQWITDQFNLPHTTMKSITDARAAAEGATQIHHVRNAWWKLANTAPDQLRHRVNFALSEIFVISTNVSLFEQWPGGMANYYDQLGRGATGNFRTLLEDVTTSPVMGDYLNLLASWKADPSRGTIPNENYPRELLQLFSVGVSQLHPDGTLKLDANGQPIDTYNQDVIIGIARALTGWSFHQTGTSDIPNPNYLLPMTPVPQKHETGSKLLLNGVVVPAGGTNQSDLKAVLDNVFAHPNVGPFICKQLIQRLVCSNPSPGYVYRVSQKFDNNGSGVRGDLKAVVRAILTDYEARSNDMIGQQGFGKLKEPLLRSTQVMRTVGATSPSGQWAINFTDDELRQTVLLSPTVFNFFEPEYVHPGLIAANGLVAPEFQITNESTTISVANWQSGGLKWGYTWGDVQLPLNVEKSLAGNPTALVNRLNLLLCSNQLSDQAKQIIINHVSTIPASDTAERARVAVQLIAVGAQFSVQR